MLRLISSKNIRKIIKNSFSEDILTIKPHYRGHINKLCEIKLKTGREVMLRLYNEPWKAFKESFIYESIRKSTDIPVPDIYCIDDSLQFAPYAYILMSKIDGMHIDEAYRKYKNKSLFMQAGEILAKLHTIRFPSYGWIIGNKIKPAFSKWRDFVYHDVQFKLNQMKSIKEISELTPAIYNCLKENESLLDIKQRASLLHKDYHCSHIITDKEKIKGIIDLEWAIAGHNENDFIKMELWAFSRIKSIRDIFFKGYLNYGNISEEYPTRKEIYTLWHWISMANISYELKNKNWLVYNLQALKKSLKK